MELSNHLNVFEHIRLALEVPERARDRDIGFYLVELAPTFESAMSFDCEFEQVVHRTFGVQRGLLSDVPIVFISGMIRRTSDCRS
jgi:hypothetical protein